MKLEIGSNDYFEVRHETYHAAINGNLSMVYLSDLHFNNSSQSITQKMIAKIEELNPDIVLLGGDYVDFKKHLVHLESLLKGIAHRKNVFGIAGNHDYRFGVDKIKHMMEANNVNWIEKSSAIIEINNNRIQIDGRKTAKEKPEADLAILCLHEPVDIDRFKDQYNLAFAGHLHGCQFVFWRHNKALYPGKLFFKWNVLEKKADNCHFYISRGMGDSVPVRFNCVKEMVYVEVTGNN